MGQLMLTISIPRDMYFVVILASWRETVKRGSISLKRKSGLGWWNISFNLI